MVKHGEMAKLSSCRVLPARNSFRRRATVRLPGLKGSSFKFIIKARGPHGTSRSFPASRFRYLSWTEMGRNGQPKGNTYPCRPTLPVIFCLCNIKVKPCAHHSCGLDRQMSKKAARRSSLSQETSDSEVEEKSNSASVGTTPMHDGKRGNSPQVAHLDNIHLDVGDVQVRRRTRWWKLWYEHFQ